MMHQFQREQVKNQLVAHTAIETFPRIELTEGKSEEWETMEWNTLRQRRKHHMEGCEWKRDNTITTL